MEKYGVTLGPLEALRRQCNQGNVLASNTLLDATTVASIERSLHMKKRLDDQKVNWYYHNIFLTYLLTIYEA